MTRGFKYNLANISSHHNALAAAQSTVLPHTCEKEMSSEYRVAAQPLTGHRNKHYYQSFLLIQKQAANFSFSNSDRKWRAELWLRGKR